MFNDRQMIDDEPVYPMTDDALCNWMFLSCIMRVFIQGSILIFMLYSKCYSRAGVSTVQK